jgi:SpoVK/Ycf46/Vps4 family AAA+-type ATPase
MKSLVFKKNTIIIEGHRSLVTSNYTFSQNISAAYSDRFKALWHHIITNIKNNDTIYQIKENHTNRQTSYIDKTNSDLFMVYQNKHFKIHDNIYAIVELQHESDKDSKDKLSIKTDKIILSVYSYNYSMYQLMEYLDTITEKYLLSIKNNRSNKKFIYSINKVYSKEDENEFNCWREDIFESARTFNNIFFDGKKQIIDKIDFFLNNKKWYYDKGIPYSLGIGLHGPPGTGKTSLIKALANYTNRNIILISLKQIKTKSQLEKAFFENTYNANNEANSVYWDKKILVFEDIDCMGDIILNREEKSYQNNKDTNGKKLKLKTNNLIHNINDNNEIIIQDIESIFKKEDPITLDDILNLWDGIRETPGRILIISSNHYDKLDPALVRPGRIDITHELSNASHAIISEIYFHLFEKNIDKKELLKIKDNYYSPAELINMYVSNKNEHDFIKRIQSTFEKGGAKKSGQR